MKQPITATDLAAFRADRAGKPLRCDADYIAVDIPPSGYCARCQDEIAAHRAHPTRYGFWLCASCLGPREGWTDVREANHHIFERNR